jgi:hypothetical protein
MENQMSVGNQNAQQVGQNPVNQSSVIPEKPRINYWMISTFALTFLFIGAVALNIINQNREAIQNKKLLPPTQQSTSTLFPTVPPAIRKQNTVYTASELSNSFKLPEGWTKDLYTKSIKLLDRGYSTYGDCSLEYCVFFENKKYVNKSNMQAYSSPIEDGRVYGYLNVISSEYLLGEKWKSVSETNFYSAINVGFPERAKARSSEECGPYYAVDKAKEITTLNYKTVLSTSYPACNYEGANQNTYEKPIICFWITVTF